MDYNEQSLCKIVGIFEAIRATVCVGCRDITNLRQCAQHKDVCEQRFVRLAMNIHQKFVALPDTCNLQPAT